MLQAITCPIPDCEHENHLRFLPATRMDPGCWDDDLECTKCGADLKPEDAEPVSEEELRWANHPDV